MAQDVSSILKATGLIFDVDGTLVDSVDFHATAWRRAFGAFGFPIEFGAIRSQIGKGGDQLMPVFLSPRELQQYGDRIEAARADIFEKDYLPQVRGFPRVSELFSFLIDAGKVLALGSSAKAKDLAAYKMAAGIEHIELIEMCSDDADRSKPHPDIFLAALSRLGLPANQVTVVGDAPYDGEAARKAGINSIVGLLCGGFPEDDLIEAGANVIFRDPEGLLLALLASARVA
jgi:phosphoglycolate phosphatase-like HAD superfamily hydrolase